VVPGTFTVASEVFYPLDYDASLNGSYSNGVWQINSPAFRDGYKYRIRVKACDNAVPTNCEVNLSSITFIYDTTPPNPVITISNLTARFKRQYKLYTYNFWECL